MTLYQLECCGVQEIDGLSNTTPEHAAKEVFQSTYYSWSNEFCHILFTQAGPRRYGERLRAYILRNGLGTVVRTRKRMNPNSNQELVAYLWTVNDKGLKRLAKKMKWEDPNGPRV